MTARRIALAPGGTALGHPVGETRECFSLGQRGRGRRLDDGGLVRAAWGEAGGRHGERLSDGAMVVEPLVQSLGELAAALKPSGALWGVRGPAARPVGRGGRAIAHKPLDARMGLEPLRPGGGGALREQRHGLAACPIEAPRPLGLAFPQGAIVPPEAGGSRQRWHRLPAAQTPQGGPADSQRPLRAAVPARRAAPRHGQGYYPLGEPQRAPGPRGHTGGQALGEETARAGAMAAQPLPPPPRQASAGVGPGQSGQPALSAAGETPCRGRAQRPGRGGRGRPPGDRARRGGGIDVARLEASRARLGDQAGKGGGGWGRNERGALLCCMGARAMERRSPPRGAHPVRLVGSDAMACVGMARITVRSHQRLHPRAELRKASSPKVAMNHESCH
jgi:hypothetical protein